MSSSFFLSSVEDVVTGLAMGEMCIVIDSADRENEGDLLIAASFITPDSMNFLTKYARGIVCVTVVEADILRLGLVLSPKKNSIEHTANFALSVDAVEKHGVTTGVSCRDRVQTIKTMLDKNSTPSDLMSPGHMFPLVAKLGGVLERPGHTEASIELMEMAGLPKMAVICEVMADNGEMMRTDGLISFAKSYNIKIVSIDEIVKYKKRLKMIG
ncbi:3,4-dihydroxy-2-butanone 4-phosphate synthase [Candidatus Xenohaliotis californiensis]|uniref:3,4-dihydroxy-2-butanone 4-phosphate synthase n=1 Tax=Candidatus Xenohaliotis californiensis TaxID=84677 RepID=A0ABP0EV97_9RICK|nr:3,4-dihydroxy-2-butanone 4-phosphate synthase [Candidatus Xenohaliotis californiensis]